MDAYKLKEYIFENNKIIEILEYIGCESIKSYTSEYRCGCEKYPNSTSIRVKKDTLKTNIFSSKKDLRGDIYTLVMDLKDVKFSKAVKIVHEILGLKYTFNPIQEDKASVDILDLFKKAKKSNNYNQNQELEVFNDDICEEFVNLPYIEWVREGIMPNTQKEFGIGYSQKNNRVIIPHRYWCGTKHDLVGIIGRTLNPNYDILEIPKYFPIKKYMKSLNLYGLQENYKTIQETGYVNVFEAEKSVLKRHSKLDGTGVALCGHEMSIEQVKILISLDVEIIIQLDKDIDINIVRAICENFYGIRKVSYIYDELGLLKNKESPADKVEKIYQALWHRKKEYNEYEHNEYLKYLEEEKERKIS